MPQLQLTKDQVIQVKVTNIKENVKQIQKREGLRFRHDISIEDRNGNTLVCEYLSEQNVVGQDFVPEVYQYIRCLYPEKNGATIEPAEPPTQSATSKNVSETLDKKVQERATDVPCSTMNLSGNSIAFSFAWGKDLVVADIMSRPYKEVTEDDVQKLIQFGVKINDGICHYLQFN